MPDNDEVPDTEEERIRQSGLYGRMVSQERGWRLIPGPNHKKNKTK